MTPKPKSLSRSTNDLLRTFGTSQNVRPKRLLKSGQLCCELEDGAVRHVHWRGVEIIRGIAYLLRDADWGTVPSTIDGLAIEESDERFQVDFDLQWKVQGSTMSAKARIQGHASGQLSFVVEASTPVPLVTNRCGFVVLHPASAARAPLVIEHTDGSVELTAFPTAVSPGQVAFDIRRLRHEPAPGLAVDCRLQAELPHDPLGKFEMEDQRNWSDASFKTYVASLLDPWPYTLPADRSMAQSVHLSVSESSCSSSSAVPAHAQAAPVECSHASQHRMPAIGLGVPLHAATMGPAEEDAATWLKPAWLVAEVDAREPDGLLPQLECLAGLAARCGALVQIDVICPEAHAPGDVAASVAQACHRAGLAIQAIRACPAPYLKSYQPTDDWPVLPGLETYAQAFARQFPQARVGGGMLTNFTELNRKRQTPQHIDFIGHGTCPLVHAADDTSVMQTHQSLAGIHATVGALWPRLGYRLGPVTMAMHRNPYGERTMRNTAKERGAMADFDPRHQGAFGAAWLAACAAAVQTFDLELLTLNHSHGCSGPMLGTDMPDWQAGAMVPAWKVQWILARASGCAVVPLVGLPADVAGLAWQTDMGGGCQMLLANLQCEERQLQLKGDWFPTDVSGPGDQGFGQQGDGALADPADRRGVGGAPITTVCLAGYQTLWLKAGGPINVTGSCLPPRMGEAGYTRMTAAATAQ